MLATDEELRALARRRVVLRMRHTHTDVITAIAGLLSSLEGLEEGRVPPVCYEQWRDMATEA
jgi:hypothetical protein